MNRNDGPPPRWPNSRKIYTYSDGGDLLTLTDDFTGTTNDVTFTDTYTNAHQLASEATSNSSYVWVSPNTGSGDTYAAVNSLNQYPSVNGNAVTWDANGNLATINGATYAHDPENRLITADASGNTTTYAYDPLGRRVAKATVGTNWGAANWGTFNWSASTATGTVFLHDGDNEIAEYDNGGSLIRRFVPGVGNLPIALMTSTGTTTFFHTDRKGSVVAMADTTGARVEGPYTYDAYGNCFVGASTTSCTTLAATSEPFRYTGQRYDAETGLYYYRARYYGPGIGRFYETDPIGYGPGIDWYSFVDNDPLDRSDPMGLYVYDMKDCHTGSHIGCALGFPSNQRKAIGKYTKAIDRLQRALTELDRIRAARAAGGTVPEESDDLEKTQDDFYQAFGLQVDGYAAMQTVLDALKLGLAGLEGNGVAKNAEGSDLQYMIDHSAPAASYPWTHSMLLNPALWNAVDPDLLAWIIAHEALHGEAGWVDYQGPHQEKYYKNQKDGPYPWDLSGSAALQNPDNAMCFLFGGCKER